MSAGATESNTPPHPATIAAPAPPARRGVDPDAFALLGLAVAVLWVYLPPAVLLEGGLLFGVDSFTVHVRRLAFAREYLFGPSPGLPAWYPREFLGTPFWSNLQNFPLLPTRLPLLFVDPWMAHTVGVSVAAVLAAAFTFAYSRRLGLGRTGAAVAGWTFACCGFFAARVLAGHLPLLEAYPALPLLLWLVERYATSDSPRARRWNLLALGVASGLVMLAGHPQLPVYAVAVALLYLPVRSSWRGALVGAAATAAGVACAALALYPMALLVARSTRVLPLEPAANDVAFPLWRLKAFVTPWADGWPSLVARGAAHVPFARGEQPVFWDTVCYAGLLPLAAAAALALRAAVTRRLPAAPWVFVAVVGAAALLLAFGRPGSGDDGSWTILRSPARQAYLTVFALALAGGAGVDALLRLRGRLRHGAGVAVALSAAVLVFAHAFDVSRHARAFVVTAIRPPDKDVPPGVKDVVGDDGRVAMDANRVDSLNRLLDDAGVFDSILLARPYRAMLALSGRPPQTNTQYINGPDLGPRALAWSGVRVVVTGRPDLSLPVLERGELTAYYVRRSLPRAGFVADPGVRVADEEAVLEELRGGAVPNARRLLLVGAADGGAPVPARPATAPAESPADGPAEVTYRRPSPDRIEIDVVAPAEGYVRVLEAWDPGWRASVDGAPAEVFLADGFVSAVRVGPGTHEVRMTYRTPGVATGLAVSAAGVVALALLGWRAPHFAAGGARA